MSRIYKLNELERVYERVEEGYTEYKEHTNLVTSNIDKIQDLYTSIEDYERAMDNFNDWVRSCYDGDDFMLPDGCGEGLDFLQTRLNTLEYIHANIDSVGVVYSEYIELKKESHALHTDRIEKGVNYGYEAYSEACKKEREAQKNLEKSIIEALEGHKYKDDILEAFEDEDVKEYKNTIDKKALEKTIEDYQDRVATLSACIDLCKSVSEDSQKYMDALDDFFTYVYENYEDENLKEEINYKIKEINEEIKKLSIRNIIKEATKS